jgi:hypothetical protein
MEPQEIDHHECCKGYDAYKYEQNIDATPPRIWVVGIERKANRFQMFLQFLQENRYRSLQLAL